MVQMGMRELKENMGRFVTLLKKNQSVTLNYRGKPLAIVQALATKGTVSAKVRNLVAKLEKKGILSRGTGKVTGDFKPLDLGGKSISDYVIESRE